MSGVGRESTGGIFRAFTLVEILVVVVILGILAAIVVPKYIGAAEDTAIESTHFELEKLRRAIEVYRVRNDNALPTVTAGNGTWGQIVSSDYLKEAPQNNWVGGVNAQVITITNIPDAAYHTVYGWIYDDSTGEVWAGAFDGNDQPHPKP